MQAPAAQRYHAAMRLRRSLPCVLAAIALLAAIAVDAGARPPVVQAPGPLGFDLQEVDPYERCAARARNAPLAGFNEAEAWRARGGGDPARHCAARARNAPLAGFNEAEAWRARGGGDPARHCAALALLHGGEPGLAAEALEALDRDMRLRPAALRAQVLAQAARAWQAAGEAGHALDAIARAVALRPADMDLRIDRAELLAEAGRLWEAVDELDAVLERNPASALALAMRAAARRRLDAPELARDDVAHALAADPRLAEAWLESGILNRQAGRLDAARRDWLQVLVLDADGPAGDAARAQIEALETGAAAPR